jgi:transposase
VSIPGTEVFGTVIASVSARLRAVQAERLAIAKQVEALLDDYPVGKTYTSMPGISSRGAAKLIAIIGDGADFPTAAHLASYAGLAPVVRRSGTSIYSVRAGSKGNRRLKTLLFESSMGLLAHNSESKAYYDKKRAEGKRHAAAMLCLTRRRVDVLHAMLRTGSLYRPPAPTNS